MKRTKLEITLAAVAVSLVLSIPLVQADEGKMDKAADSVSQTAKDTKNGAKKAVRGAEDKGCPLVNGKMDCAAKKVKHKGENLGDKLSK